MPARKSINQANSSRHAALKPRRLRSSYSLAVVSLYASAFGFFGVGGLPQSPVFFIKKRRMIRRRINNQNIGIAPRR